MPIISGSTSLDGVQVVKSTNDTPAININSSGVVTLPNLNWYGGSPTNTSNSSIANSHFARFGSRSITFGSTTRTTVSTSGVYFLSFNSISSQSSGRKDLDIRVNGTIVTTSLLAVNLSGYGYRSCGVCMNLAANDYIEYRNDDWYNSGVVNDEFRTSAIVFLG